MRKLLVVALNMTIDDAGSSSWSAKHSWMVSMRLENKERMMLVVVGGLLGKDESESIS